MFKWKRILALSLPFPVIAYYALIVSSQIRGFDFHLNYIGENDLVDSGVGWFPLIWLVGATPFIVLALISKRFAHPSKQYWTIILGAFAGLSAIGFWLDHMAYYQICKHFDLA